MMYSSGQSSDAPWPIDIPIHSLCFWRWAINEEGRVAFLTNGHDLLTYVYFSRATK
jgi:hypothetical protein